MRDDFTVLLGTVGTCIWRSPDGGQTWTRPKGERPRMPWSELQCFDIQVHPGDPQTIFAGTNEGIYRSDDQGASFERLDSPLNDYDVWSIVIDPVETNTIFAGCRPGAVFRSKDSGLHWEKLSAQFAEHCANVSIPRVLTLAIDPGDHRIVWAGAEVDGIRRSLDGGDTWTKVDSLAEPDIHYMVVSAGSPSKVITSTNSEIYLSDDVGESWQSVGVAQQFPMRFCRGLAIKPDDPNVVFVGNGNNFIGDKGVVLRSLDRGENWETRPLPVEPNSPIWKFAVNQADPNLVLCDSHYGELFCSEDAGDSWRKLEREFGETRPVAWTPN